MYIKQVIIQGFRSYRDQTIIEPFSSKNNVIVGRNGSGKSNFFFAIQFVLSDEFSHLRPEQRQQLLHEGTGPRVVSAFVEIVFDNSDGRIPIENDEVRIRRVIGAKKDQYYLEKKNVTKTDVMNLLESAGFSRSNPYYIVKQGKINELAIAPDSQRLKLLREVAGTRVYDERREESKIILQETEGKREKINELLQDIEQRLHTLEEETKELKEFQELDRTKRSLEYTIYDKGLREAQSKIKHLEVKHQEFADTANTQKASMAKLANKIEEYEAEVQSTTQKKEILVNEQQDLYEERQELIKKRTNLELDVSDLTDSVQNDRSVQESSKSELQQLQLTITNTETELNKLVPTYESHKENEQKLTSRLRMCEQLLSQIYAKQGRGTAYKSKEERDAWISREMKQLQKSLTDKKSEMAAALDIVQKAQNSLAGIEAEVEERNKNIESRKVAIDESRKFIASLRQKLDEALDRRKELWREEQSVDQALQSVEESLKSTERSLMIKAPKGISRGLESLKRVVSEKKIKGVYGPLIENFRSRERFFTAIEVTAGNRLFHVIVDTDRTAAQILNHFNHMKLPGEISFMPLNKLISKDIQYPDSTDAVPIIHRLECEDRFKPALKQVFDKTLLCRNIEYASKIAKENDLDCVTLEGDQISRRGALTGGYHDERISRLTLQHKIWQLQDDLDKQTYERQRLDIRANQTKRESYYQDIKSKKDKVKVLETDIQEISTNLRSLQSEIGTDLASQLSDNDRQEAEKLNNEVQELKRRLIDAVRNRTSLESKKNELDYLLHSNLIRRQRELQQQMEEITIEDHEMQLDHVEKELSRVKQNIAKASKRLEELSSLIETNTKHLEDTANELDDLKKSDRIEKERFEGISKKAEKWTNKSISLQRDVEEYSQKISALGVLPADAFDKYQEVPMKILWKKLSECNDGLKKYEHVNKKALDQYVNFSQEKEKLMKRKDELDKGHEAIIELMEVLELRKHETIQFTFKQVSHYFSEVFKELVPNGKANLLIRRNIGTDSESQSQSQTSSGSQSIEHFTGVGIEVSFTGLAAETCEMQQLSGGQKSLVALAMIFAIQKCDPAPFYLFDEIDQALDSQHRTAVANMLRKLAEKAQFITTTFRPELVQSADKFYGVRFRNKVSHIDAISKEEALQFIVGDDD
ncbi:Structural maintenance of chromosomes protein 3 [Trichoplax sp. H2]|nr:Structural maintenance of chromosomes protein 3 [Trichoplax sp. H2]|eukprot:RDD37399.1 Structural maintenance of chromosomes protein 3 [Trichoplax sp. H2]